MPLATADASALIAGRRCGGRGVHSSPPTHQLVVGFTSCGPYVVLGGWWGRPMGQQHSQQHSCRLDHATVDDHNCSAAAYYYYYCTAAPNPLIGHHPRLHPACGCDTGGNHLHMPLHVHPRGRGRPRNQMPLGVLHVCVARHQWQRFMIGPKCTCSILHVYNVYAGQMASVDQVALSKSYCTT